VSPTQEQVLGSRETIRLVAGREIRTRMATKAFRVTTLLFVLAVVGGGLVLKAVSASESTSHVAVTSEAAAASPAIQAAADAVGVTVEVEQVPDEAAAEERVRSGDLDVLVTGTSPQLTIVVKDKLGPTLAPMFGALAQQLALVDAVERLGGDPAQVTSQIAEARPDVQALEPTPEVDGGQVVAGYVAGLLLFLSLMTAGQLVAQGVVEEKSSRVVELLLSTVRPWQLMAGKVLGIGIVGLTQVAATLGAGVVTAFALGLLDTTTLDIGSAAVWALVWFVIGFASYALVLAALGSLVSRQEDVASVIGPVTALMVVPYIIGISITPWDPHNPLVAWLSYIPFCAPMIMPIRIAVGAVEGWEIALSVALSLALIPVLVWVAGRVYSNAVLRSGGRVSLRTALAAPD
jgi:ABC-2 type transport system permease protein